MGQWRWKPTKIFKIEWKKSAYQRPDTKQKSTKTVQDGKKQYAIVTNIESGIAMLSINFSTE